MRLSMTPVTGATTRVSRAWLLVARSSRFGRRESCARGSHRLFGVLVVTLGDGACLEQRRVLLECPLCVREIGARCGDDVGLSALVAALLLVGLEAGEQLTRAHLLSFAHVHVREVAFDAGADVDRFDGPQIAGERDARLDVGRAIVATSVAASVMEGDARVVLPPTPAAGFAPPA